MSRVFRVLTFASVVMFASASSSFAAGTQFGSGGRSGMLSDGQIGWFTQGARPTACNYEWWYGCSPTAAGMMIGDYDRDGYEGLAYDNLVPGGIAESQTFTRTTGWDALANNAIASPGHVEAFYVGGYLADSDDLPRDESLFDCLADFMGTSQDIDEYFGNPNGSTKFFYYATGAKLHAWEIEYRELQDYDGMFGIGEYVEYAGYSYDTLYTQATDIHMAPTGIEAGFTLADYKAEIDAGRSVLLHVTDHSMYGYGYKDDTILFYNTWDRGRHSMTWGDTYDDRELWGVTVLELSGGLPLVAVAAVPEPAVWLLLALCGVGFGGRWSRKAAKQ